MANPKWFDDNVYMNNKLAQLKAADADTYGSWDMYALEKAFSDAGFPGEEGAFAHFNQYGNTAEENISPNSNFIAKQYYVFKAADYYDVDVADVTSAQAAYIADAIEKAGMSAWQHYVEYGTEEGVNPSNNFDTNKYLDAKLAALKAADSSTYGNWTRADVAKAISDAGMNALSHAVEYADGTTAGEAAAPFDADGNVIDAYKVDEKADSGEGDSSAGETLTLTANTDYADTTTAALMNGTIQSAFRFTNADETINAKIAGTLTDADMLLDSSTSDNDVLDATLNNGAVTPTLQNIETLNIKVTANNAGLALTNATGVKTVNMTVSGGTHLAGFTGVLNAVDATAAPAINFTATGNNNLTITTKTLAGAADALTVTLDGTAVNSDGDAPVLTITAADAKTLETLTLVSAGDEANAISLNKVAPIGDIEKYTIGGSQDLEIRDVNKVLGGAELDASGNSGNVSVLVDVNGADHAVTTYNVEHFTGVDALTFVDSNDTTNNGFEALGVANGATIRVGSSMGEASTVALASASGSSDSVTVELNSTATKGTTVDLAGLTAAGVETLNLVSNHGKSGTANDFGGITDAALKTMTISGDSAATVTVNAASVAQTNTNTELTFDASKLEKNLTLDTGDVEDTTSGGRTVKVIGGQGDDVITLGSTAATVKQSVDLSEGGTDTIIFSVGASSASLEVKGFDDDIFDLKGGGAGSAGHFWNALGLTGYDQTAINNTANAAAAAAVAADQVKASTDATEVALLFKYSGSTYIAMLANNTTCAATDTVIKVSGTEAFDADTTFANDQFLF